jgi:hypothetical protein
MTRGISATDSEAIAGRPSPNRSIGHTNEVIAGCFRMLRTRHRTPRCIAEFSVAGQAVTGVNFAWLRRIRNIESRRQPEPADYALRIVLGVFESRYGGHSRIRTYDFHRVKVALYR